jgi:aspartate-semialdehyde dehydrogenase
VTARIPVAVLGATGVVGQRIVRRLVDHPRFEIVALAASERSVGKRYADAVHWEENDLPSAVRDLEVVPCTPDAAPAPIVLSALDAETARRAEPEFAHAGSLVVTNASPFRLAPDVPLIIPEVNPDHLDLLDRQRRERGWSGGIIANPNCATAVIVLALAPLHRAFGVRRVAVTTLQAASGAGFPGVASLDLLGNIIPHIAGEEEKLAAEPRKLLGTLRDGVIAPASFLVSPQVTRVPVHHGHMATLAIEFDRPVKAKEAREAFDGWRPAVSLVDGAARPQPRRDVDLGGGMTVSVGQLREDGVFGLRLVALGHNLERGAAGAAVANAELVVARLAARPTVSVGSQTGLLRGVAFRATL